MRYFKIKFLLIVFFWSSANWALKQSDSECLSYYSVKTITKLINEKKESQYIDGNKFTKSIHVDLDYVDCHMNEDRTTWPGEHHFNRYTTHVHTWQVIVNGGDKSHNHKYTKAILNYVIEKSTDIVTDVNDNSTPVKEFALYQNYPNRFNTTTTIQHSIPKSSKATMKVFDLLENKVVVFVNKYQTVGTYQTYFEVSNLSAGIYFYRMKAGSFASSKKLILFK